MLEVLLQTEETSIKEVSEEEKYPNISQLGEEWVIKSKVKLETTSSTMTETKTMTMIGSAEMKEVNVEAH